MNDIAKHFGANPLLSLADILHMSRSTLYRKIKDISNLSPNELINNARLKKAAALLLSNNTRYMKSLKLWGINHNPVSAEIFKKAFPCLHRSS